MSVRIEGDVSSSRICIVLWGGTIGGAETLMAETAALLNRRGISASVLCVGDIQPLGRRLEREGVGCVGLGHRRGGGALLRARRLARTIAELGPDGAIVNASGYLPTAIRAAGYRGPMVAVEHGDMLNLHLAPLRRRLRVKAERWLCSRSRYVDVAVSDTMLGAFERVTGRRRARRIYNGVNLRRFAAPPMRPSLGEELTIGVASRLAQGKGIDVVLAACAALDGRHPWSLKIAGQGPERERLQAIVQGDSSLSRRVVFCGGVSDMPAFWAGCDVAVVPSAGWIESFSMAAVEAMACGVPVIASGAGALREVLGGCGTLVPPSDAQALCEALGGYLADPARRLEHGAQGRRRAEAAFDIERMVDQYLDALGWGSPPQRRVYPHLAVSPSTC